MSKFNTLITLILLSMITCMAYAQDATLKGTVTDSETAEPLGFVNISVAVNDETKGAQTDFDGNYTLTLPPGNHTIKFSYVGYATKEMTELFAAGDVKTIDVKMGAEEELLKTVVVSAGKFEQQLGEQTVSLEVIKPSLVENSNTTSIEQTVEKVPGVDVVDGQANIRGGSGYSYGAGSRVMLLMDDIPVLTADAGFPNWSFLPIENLEQVEIIKGASSALYGSSALNGIINLRTAYPKSEPFTKITLFTGVYQNPRDNEVITYARDLLANPDDPDNSETVDLTPIDTVSKSWWGNKYPYESGASFAHRQKFNQFDLVLGGYLFNRDSWRKDEYERRARFNTNLRYRFPNTPGLSVGLNINTQVNTSGSFLIWNMDDGIWDNDNLTWNAEDQKWVPKANLDEANRPLGLAGAYQLWSATPPINNRGLRWTIDPFVEYFSASGLKLKLLGRYFKSDNYNDTNQSTLSDLYYGEFQAQKRWEDLALTVTTGVATIYGTVDAELYAGNTFSTNNVAGYLQLDKKFFDKLNVSLGTRYEYNKISERDAESRPVFRAGLNYQPLEYTFIRASWGQGYRFPTIAESFVRTDLGAVQIGGLGGGVPVGIFPNIALESETGWSGEIGIKQGVKLGDWQGFIDVSGFINEYQNMMEFTFGVSDPLTDLIKNGVLPLGIEPIWEQYLDGVVEVGDSTTAVAGFQSVNIGDTRILGLDMSIAGQGELFGLKTGLLAGYTFIKPEFQDFNELQQTLSSGCYDTEGNLIPDCKNVLKYRFPHTIKLDAETQIGKFTPGISFRYFSFMEAIDEAFNRFLPGIKEFREDNNGGTTIIDARVLYHITDQSFLSLVCKNVLNAEYALRPALIDAPRNFTIKYVHEF